MIKKTSLRDFFQQAFGILELKEGEIIDVTAKQVKVKSFNHITGEDEFNIVKYLIRKKDSKKYLVNNELECSKEHRLYVHIDKEKLPRYEEVGNLFSKKFKVFSSEGLIDGFIEKTSDFIEVYDMEVNKVNNYYSNGLLSHNSYIPLTEPGGEAWKYLQSLKIEISKSLDKDSEGTYGIVVKGKVTKSKVCIPYKTFEYYIKFGEGIIREKEILDLAIEKDLIKKGGAWFTILEDNKIQGEDLVIKFLQDNPEFTKELENKILEI